ICEAAGIRAEVDFRDQRRTAASEALAAEGRAEPITGHKPGSSVLKTYEMPSKKSRPDHRQNASRKQIGVRKVENPDEKS
ncbi:MAG: hypothetical protein HQ504_00160, partial [Rhodospirillaceae bacterium]|nr:hypothetical protein [Rhodospirillaceae bacterium]